MHRRIEIDWALSNMTPKAVPAAPLGLLARQCHADADVDTAAAIVPPPNIGMRTRLIIALRSAVFLLPALAVSRTLSSSERRRHHSIAHSGAHGAWWFWPRK